MSVKEIIAKLKEMDSMTDDERTELNEELGKVDNLAKKLKESESKASRILGEKKTTQAKLEELGTQMETLQNTGLTDVEKVNKDMEKLTKERDKMQKELNTSVEALKNTKRSYAITQISSDVKFLDTIPSDIRSMSVESALDKIEDLDDAEAVKTAVNDFKESHSSMLVAETVAVGSGSTTQANGTTSLTTAEDTTAEKMSTEDRQTHLKTKQNSARF